MSSSAIGGPEGGQVVRGDATITATGNGVDVSQRSAKAVIDWQRFSIGADEVIRFRQPSTRSTVVNRVTGGEASNILGSLLANGRVVLSNPAGITIGRSAVIQAASLVATTARLAERDLDAIFRDDVFRFEEAPPGSFVINRGEITVADGGLAALVAPWVANQGVITARFGRVTLASGSAFTLDLYGDGLLKIAIDERLAGDLGMAPEGLEARLEQSKGGKIGADGGRVALEVAAASRLVDQLINMDGIIEARSTSRRSTGEIVLRGTGEGVVEVAGTLDSSGQSPADSTENWRGGQVFVMGDDIRLRDSARLDVSGGALAGAITLAGGTGDESGFLPVGQLSLSDRAVLRLANRRSGEAFVATVITADRPAAAAEARPSGAVVTAVKPLGSFAFDLVDPDNPSNRVELMPPGTPVGESFAYQVRGDGKVFVDGVAKGDFSSEAYDFFVTSTDGTAVSFDSLPTEGTTPALIDGRLGRLNGRLQSPQSSAQFWNPTTRTLASGNRGPGNGPRNPEKPIKRPPPPTEQEQTSADGDQCNSWRLDHAVSDAGVARCYAALALDAIAVHASTSFGALLAALDDPSPISRARAVSELGDIGAYLSAAVPVLIEALSTEDDRVAQLAAGVLDDADSFARDVVPALGKATRDDDDRVVRNAAVALGGLGAYATPALPVLDDTLEHPDVAARFNAAEGIAKVDAEMRSTTLALARVTAEQATLAGLEGALGQDRSPFRARAVGTLAAVTDETRAAAEATRPRLAAADPAERAAAVTTLGELDRIGGAALPVLIRAVSLPESRALRASLSDAADELPLDAATVRPLLQALNDRDPAVRAAAAAALEDLAATASRAGAELAQLPREDLIVRRLAGRAETALAGFAPAALPALEVAVADDDPRVRGHAVSALGYLGETAEPSVPLLVAALAGEDAFVHRPAARALGRIGAVPAAAVPALADRLFDSDPRVACEAARALGLFGEEALTASPRLLAAAEADQAGPGFCAGVALFAVDPPAALGLWPEELSELRATLEVEAMLEAIKGPAPLPRQADMPVGPAAVAALPELVAALANAPAEDRAVLAGLLTTVALEIRDEVPWLARELAHGDAAARATAVRLLGRLSTGTSAAVPGLLDGLAHADATVRFAMVRTLSLLTAQTTAATQALLAVALEDESSTVRADATTSLRQLAAVQQAASQGVALVTKVPIGRAGQRLLQVDRRLSVTQ